MIKYFFPALFLFSIYSCQNTQKAPDVSDIAISPEVIRFEKELFQGDTQNVEVLIERLNQKYPEFSDVFFKQIIADPTFNNDVTRSTRFFVRDSFIRALFADCNDLYQNFEPYTKEIEEGLKYFKHYFPDKPVPDIYTCITGFEYGSFTVGDQILAIGLDFYLGSDYPNYHPDLFPVFIRHTMAKEYLVAKSIQTLVNNYHGETRGNRLVDYIIHNGIGLYVKKKLLPFSSDTVLFEYSPDQLEWLQENESEIWGYFIEKDLLLSSDYRNFQKIISPSPNVPGMPPEAPGQLGNWIGERIIESYMDRHPETSLQALLQLDDSQKILAESKYKPRR